MNPFVLFYYVADKNVDPNNELYSVVPNFTPNYLLLIFDLSNCKRYVLSVIFGKFPTYCEYLDFPKFFSFEFNIVFYF